MFRRHLGSQVSVPVYGPWRSKVGDRRGRGEVHAVVGRSVVVAAAREAIVQGCRELVVHWRRVGCRRHGS